MKSNQKRKGESDYEGKKKCKVVVLCFISGDVTVNGDGCKCVSIGGRFSGRAIE